MSEGQTCPGRFSANAVEPPSMSSQVSRGESWPSRIHQISSVSFSVSATKSQPDEVNIPYDFPGFFIDKDWGDVKMLIYYELFGGQVGMVLN